MTQQPLSQYEWAGWFSPNRQVHWSQGVFGTEDAARPLPGLLLARVAGAVDEVVGSLERHATALQAASLPTDQ